MKLECLKADGYVSQKASWPPSFKHFLKGDRLDDDKCHHC